MTSNRSERSRRGQAASALPVIRAVCPALPQWARTKWALLGRPLPHQLRVSSTRVKRKNSGGKSVVVPLPGRSDRHDSVDQVFLCRRRYTSPSKVCRPSHDISQKEQVKGIICPRIGINVCSFRHLNKPFNYCEVLGESLSARLLHHIEDILTQTKRVVGSKHNK